VVTLKFTTDRPPVAMIKPSGRFEQKLAVAQL